MDEREADERYTRLVSNVAEARDLLMRTGEDHWGTWMTDVHAALTAHDAYGLSRLLGAYGGMGSFNDLIIYPANGHQVDEDNADRVNRSLVSLRAAMYTDAKALIHDLEQHP